MFTAADITSKIREQPFKPIRIITSSGTSYDVYHPDLILVGRREIVIGTALPDDPLHFDRTARIAILHVTDIQDLPPNTPPTASNGQASGT
jgi:hypothetical protein